MHNEETLRWAVDKSSKNLVSILNVESGIECNCLCPVCGAILVAHKGKKVTHHFKHDRAVGCKGSAETAIHLKAKQIIKANKILNIPHLSIESKLDEISKSINVVSQGIIELDNVILESRVGSIIPDLIVSYKGTKLLVEIAVTHFIDSDKKLKIQNQGISCIEIDLQKLHKSKGNITDMELLENVIHRVDNKTWIYNKKCNSKKKGLKEQLYLEKQLNIKKQKEKEKECRLLLTKEVNHSLNNSPKINFNLEASEYLESNSNSNSNRVLFEIHGELYSTTKIQGTEFSHSKNNFITHIEFDTDDNSMGFFEISIQGVILDIKKFEILIENELRLLSSNNLYTWLSKSVNKISRY